MFVLIEKNIYLSFANFELEIRLEVLGIMNNILCINYVCNECSHNCTKEM